MNLLHVYSKYMIYIKCFLHIYVMQLVIWGFLNKTQAADLHSHRNKGSNKSRQSLKANLPSGIRKVIFTIICNHLF